MPALIPAILEGVLFLLLFLIDLLLFLLLLLLLVLFRCRSSGTWEEKQPPSCSSVPRLSSLLRSSLPYAAEKKVEFLVLGFRIYHSNEIKGIADAAEGNDLDYPESMASRDFEPDTTEMVVVEQQGAITEQAEISSEHFGVTEPIPNRRGIPPQREDKWHRDVLEEEQHVIRCCGRSRRHSRKQ